MRRRLIAGILLWAAMASGTAAQTPPATQDTVSREEYDRLKQDQDALRREVESLRQERGAPAPATAPASQAAEAAQPATTEDVDDLQRQIKDLKDQVHRVLPGTEHLIIAGDAAVGFVTQR